MMTAGLRVLHALTQAADGEGRAMLTDKQLIAATRSSRTTVQRGLQTLRREGRITESWEPETGRRVFTLT